MTTAPIRCGQRSFWMRLKERGIHATFFLIGSNIPGNEELVKRMEEEGHLIGNHTYSHVKTDSMDILADQEELEKTNSLVKAITGKSTEYIRPPFGAWNKEMEHAMDVFSVLWDVDTLRLDHLQCPGNCKAGSSGYQRRRHYPDA